MGCRKKSTEKKTPLFLIGTTRLRAAGVQRGTGHTQGLVLHKDSSRGERSHAGTGRTKRIDLFTNTAAILNLIDLRSITRCPGGDSLSIYAHLSGKQRTSLYISREKGDYYYIQTRHNDLFFQLQSFSRKT